MRENPRQNSHDTTTYLGRGTTYQYYISQTTPQGPAHHAFQRPEPWMVLPIQVQPHSPPFGQFGIRNITQPRRSN